MRALALDRDLDGVDLRVFLCLFARLNFEYYTRIELRDIAEVLGKERTHVSRSVRKLKAKEIIIEALPRIGRSPQYVLNANYGR